MLIALQNVELSTSLQVGAISKHFQWVPVEYGLYKRGHSTVDRVEYGALAPD